MMSVTWLNPGGGEQMLQHWEDGAATTIAVRFARDDLKARDDVWWEALVLFNPHDGPVDFTLPERASRVAWSIQLNTNDADTLLPSEVGGGIVTLEARTLLLLA
jgi:glycogen operon protein